LRELVEFDLDAQELGERLTMLGLETEAIESHFRFDDSLVIGKVLSVEKHPDADRLVVCRVDVGDQALQIVCGAPNVRADLAVPVALVGSTLAGGVKIRKARVRGVESEGMIASEMELGLADESEGIMELETGLAPGAKLSHFIPADWVLNLDVPPNRADCLGMIGIARELSAALGKSLELPQFDLHESETPVHDVASVTIEDREGCPRYCARVIRGIGVDESPLWLKLRLQLAGLRPINNIVDATNYVLMETGHPLHAFDLSLIGDHKIVVRRPRAGESLTTLDGIARQLTDDVLLICDASSPVAAAGVMGSENSEVGGGTDSILLESAYFDPFIIRRSSRAMELRTEASKRFERGADREMPPLALDRVTAMIHDLAGGSVLAGMIDEYPGKKDSLTVAMNWDRIEDTLGVDLDRDECSRTLSALGFSIEDDTVMMPSHRSDISGINDLAEEIGRHIGYDSIPSDQTGGLLAAPAFVTEPIEDLIQTIRRISCASGYDEVVTSSFDSDRNIAYFSSFTGEETGIEVKNPVNTEERFLRTSLIPGVLKAAGHNIRSGYGDLRLFEVGKVFRKSDPNLERHEFCAVCTGAMDTEWISEGHSSDFFDIKGLSGALLDTLRVDSVRYDCYDGSVFEKSESAVVSDSTGELGVLGLIRRDFAASLDIKHPVFVVLLDVEKLCERSREILRYRRFARFPKVKRDVALVVDRIVPAGDVIGAFKDMGPDILSEVGVFDVYEGDQIEQGKKSLGVGIVYSSEKKTLTDEEVEKVHRKLVDRVVKKFDARIR
jgi:phenylalanyl-tRNA synthetase beta chain